MDRDYDGKLSFEEFMGEETPLERLFHSMDKDGDGAVTKEVDKVQKKIFFTNILQEFISVCKNLSPLQVNTIINVYNFEAKDKTPLT